MNKTRGFAIFCLVMASILWSTGGLLIKWVEWSPIAIAGMRSGIATIILLIYWRLKYKRKLPLPDRFVLLSALNYANLVVLFVFANKLTTSANAILLQFTAPIWVLVFGALFFKEILKMKDLITVAIVIIGMSLFFIGDLNGGGTLGNILALFSGVSMGLMILSLKNVKTRQPIEIIIWGNALTFIVGLPFYSMIQYSDSNFIGIVLLGVFQLGLAYIFFTLGIVYVSALEGILIPVIEPLLNPVWVYFGTGEKPTVQAMIGGIIVIGAVMHKSLSDGKLEPIEEILEPIEVLNE